MSDPRKSTAPEEPSPPAQHRGAEGEEGAADRSRARGEATEVPPHDLTATADVPEMYQDLPEDRVGG